MFTSIPKLNKRVTQYIHIYTVYYQEGFRSPVFSPCHAPFWLGWTGPQARRTLACKKLGIHNTHLQLLRPLVYKKRRKRSASKFSPSVTVSEPPLNLRHKKPLARDREPHPPYDMAVAMAVAALVPALLTR